MGKAHFARPGDGAAADEAGIGDRVVGREEGAGGDEGSIGRQQAADRVDLGASAQWAPGASSKESGGRIVTIRFASIVLPEPGGPTSSTLSPKRLLSWPFCFVSHQVAKAMKVAPSTLVRSETHVEIADTYPFMQRPDWK
jgi:hypothetical protein